MTHLRKMMLEELQRRNYSDLTANAYIRTVAAFAKYFGKPPDKLGPDHLRQYQAYLLKECKLSVGSVVARVAALRFFYVRTLKRHDFRQDLPYPKKQRRLPIVPQARNASPSPARYGISGRPDRIIRTANGITPVELKSGSAPRNGPYETHLAQLAVYCLLIEEQYQTTVREGVIQYSDHSISVPFDDRRRKWILALTAQVHTAKKQNSQPRRSHQHLARCRGCGFRQERSEALN